jgi:hypothetical protein
MARRRTGLLVVFLLAAVTALPLPSLAHAASCEAIIGQWAWFIGGVVTVKPDGTFTQQSGNAGTWECTDAARGRFTFRWRDGGFVNSLAVSPDGQGLTSMDQSQWYVTAQRSAPAPQPQPAREEDCCQEDYDCEVKKIEAAFDQKLATCHYPGNADCNSEAVSTKASGLKAAGEKLRLCQRAAAGGISSGAEARGVPLSASNDEFHSTERAGGSCRPCADQATGGSGDIFDSDSFGSNKRQPPWGKRVKVDGDPKFQKQIGDCFRRYQSVAQRHAKNNAVVIQELLDILSDKEDRTSVTIRAADVWPLGASETFPVGMAQAGKGRDAIIKLDSLNVSQHFSELAKKFRLPAQGDVCDILIHELDHARRIFHGTEGRKICQLEGGSLEEMEISAMALENAFRILTNREPIWGYETKNGIVRLPEYAIRPTLKDFELASAGGWCP